MNDNFIKLLQGVTGFDWDEGNLSKVWNRHKISVKEVEQVFVNPPFLSFYDEKHSKNEVRYAIYGETNTRRCLCVIFTIRETKIRVISARGFHQKELRKYQQRKEK